MTDSIKDFFPEFMPIRDEQSNLSRYIQAHDDEIAEINSEIEEAILKFQIDNVELREDRPTIELDRLGRLFGDVGRRRGRTDEEYIQFLKSIVPIFAGRGEQKSIRRAVAAALLMDEEEIGIDENFTQLEFEIILSEEWESHSGSIIESIVDRARPSGVKHGRTRYELPEEEATAATAIATTDGQQILEEPESATDFILVGIRIHETFEDTLGQDTVSAFDNDRQALDTSLSTVAVTEDLDVDVWTTTDWDLNRWDQSDWDQDVPYVPLRASVKQESDIDQPLSAVSSAADAVQTENFNNAWDLGDYDESVWA